MIGSKDADLLRKFISDRGKIRRELNLMEMDIYTSRQSRPTRPTSTRTPATPQEPDEVTQ